MEIITALDAGKLISASGDIRAPNAVAGRLNQESSSINNVIRCFIHIWCSKSSGLRLCCTAPGAAIHNSTRCWMSSFTAVRQEKPSRSWCLDEELVRVTGL